MAPFSILVFGNFSQLKNVLFSSLNKYINNSVRSKIYHILIDVCIRLLNKYRYIQLSRQTFQRFYCPQSME